MSRARRRGLRWAWSAAPAIVLAGTLLAGCVGPATEANATLHQWLADVSAHSVAYAYTLLSHNAELRTQYDSFFSGVNSSNAKFKVVTLRVVSANDVLATVRVSNPGAQPRLVKVQVIEEGNAGDWLVGAPFSTQGAQAIRDFQ